jgi:catechol 2,3-dioxygenase-like lactoylglutathione lyase family enzyme
VSGHPVSGRAIPILPALDLDETLAFYRRLGFAVALRQTEPDVYAIVRRGEIEIHFWGCSDRRIAENSACYVRLDNVQALFDEFEATGIGRLGALEDKPWGMREFHVIDPSGNLIRIGQVAGSGDPNRNHRDRRRL